MTPKTADLVICGAGIAGLAAAYHLAVRQGVKNIILADERSPLSLTSSKSLAAYRNWWPNQTMLNFINRSIDLLEELAEESNNIFNLNRRGYAFLTASANQIPQMARVTAQRSKLGAGPVRYHPDETEAYSPSPATGFEDSPDGIDLILDGGIIRQHYPFVTANAVAMTHIRRGGWLNAQRLGNWLLTQAQRHGAQLLRDKVEDVVLDGNKLQAVQLASGHQISTGKFVIAAGPYLKQVGAMLGVDLPVVNEQHGKMAFTDYLGIVPQDAPFLIWNDPLYLPWADEDNQEFMLDQDTSWLLNEFPAGVRFRPGGDPNNPLIYLIWTYDSSTMQEQPTYPLTFSPYYGEILLRGLSQMIPGLSAYFGQGKKGYIDGGYYCKTRENRPLVGPLPVEGAYVIGALSGYGIMAAQAAADLLAAHITGGPLPDYAPAFLLERYDDPAYQATLENLEAATGQL